MEVRILSTQSGDWEGLFINGELVREGHTLEEGDRTFMLEMSDKYGFRLSDVESFEITDEDDKLLYEYGCFPKTITELSGQY